MTWPVRVDPVWGCWLWTGRLDAHGYPRHGARHATRAVWEAHRGPVPEGLELDHLCRRRACVRPTHLEPVDKAENERRKSWRYRCRRRACPAGHPFGDHGRLTPEGGRTCRACDR